jgi:hypothetical protein
LQILHKAQVLKSEKTGTDVWYWINKQWLEDTFSDMLNYIQVEC